MSIWKNLIAGANKKSKVTITKVVEYGSRRIRGGGGGGGDKNVSLIYKKIKAFLNAKAKKPDTLQLVLLPEERPSLTLLEKIANRISWRVVVAAPLVAAAAVGGDPPEGHDIQAAEQLAIQAYVPQELAQTGEDMLKEYIATRGVESIDMRMFFEALDLSLLEDVVRPYAPSIAVLVSLPQPAFQELHLTTAQSLLVKSAADYLNGQDHQVVFL